MIWSFSSTVPLYIVEAGQFSPSICKNGINNVRSFCNKIKKISFERINEFNNFLVLHLGNVKRILIEWKPFHIPLTFMLKYGSSPSVWKGKSILKICITNSLLISEVDAGKVKSWDKSNGGVSFDY